MTESGSNVLLRLHGHNMFQLVQTEIALEMHTEGDNVITATNLKQNQAMLYNTGTASCSVYVLPRIACIVTLSVPSLRLLQKLIFFTNHQN